ncbi:MAG: hypothetical protein AB1Z98_16710 [Nannocystaceae bacterium]
MALPCGLLLACSLDRFIDGEVEAPPDASGSFELLLDEVDRPDRVFEVEVVGAPPGADIVLVVTNASGGEVPCPGDIEPLCLTITGTEWSEQRSMTDDDGEAWWYVPFGAAGGDDVLGVQAYTISDEPWVSNGLRLRVP